MEGLLNVLSLVCTVALGLIFATSGVAKLRDPQRFASALAAQGYLPRIVRRAVIVVLPAGEMLLGALLITGIGGNMTFAATLALLLTFTGVMAVGFQGKGTLDCGCFGSVLGATTFRGLIARNAFFAVLAVLPLATDRPDGMTSIVTAGGVVAFSLLALAGRELLRRLLAGALDAESVESPTRRAFLQSLGAISGGAILVGLVKATGAEAACSYCGSCSQEILWIGCNGSCCAGYWVRDRMNCDGSCYACSGWRLEQWCSAWECC